MTTFIVSAAAVGELVVDKLPGTPSRKQPIGFGARLMMGGLSGAVLGMRFEGVIAGMVAGVIGAVIGTLGGAASRARLAGAIGKDLPVALIEDLTAIGGALLIVSC